LPKVYDVVVAGGSVAGLAFASEASRQGAEVLVAEEHPEVGEPEKCDGLVSLRGLVKYGHPPDSGAVQSKITSAVIHSPKGVPLSIDASALEVVVLDRSAYDKQLSAEAESSGATIMTATRVNSAVEKDGLVEVGAGGDSLRARYYADSTGPASSPRRGILPAAKYEVEGDWVREHVVEVFLDADLYPGYFAWVIPYGGKKAKVGAAGYGISPFRALDSFLSTRETTILRKVSAPIYVGGPAQRFVEGRRLLVGESAGQVKPTTAGGIMTSVAGAVIAAKWSCASLKKDDPSLLANYQPEWESAFLKEMKTMLRLRGVLEKLSNDDLDVIMAALATPKLTRKLSRSDFDFHGTALLGALGIPGLLKVARVVTSAEVRSLLVDS